MASNTAWKEHLSIIRDIIKDRNSEVGNILDKCNKNLVENRIKKLKIKYISMLDTELFKIPSKVVKVNEIKGNGYRIEKLVMESLKSYFVPMNLYVPEGYSKTERPAILVNIGHYIEGKALPEIQIMCANLALQGFIVLTFDPICQGERDMFPELEHERRKKDMWVVEQHMKVGNQCYLLGYNSINYFLNDAVKAVDYLVSRQDVDINRIGVTGQSGGGTLSYLLAALDERIKAAAPVHCLSTMDRICENGIGDSEQSMINMLYKGFDTADFLWMIAPRSLFISAGTRDFFSIEGVYEIFHELKRVYEILECKTNIDFCEIDVEHNISREVRETIYNFFNELFLEETRCTEQSVSILSQDQLSCDIRKLNSLTPIDYNVIMLKKIKRHGCAANCEHQQITNLARKLFTLNQEDFEMVSDVSFDPKQGSYKNLTFRGENYLEFKADISINLKEMATCVYIDMEKSIDVLSKMQESPSNIIVVRPFGSCENSYKFNTEYDSETKLAYQGIVTGKSIFEIRLSQILFVLDFIRQEGFSGDILIYGKRQGALLALFACLFNSSISKAHCEELIFSFSSIIGKKEYLINETDIIPGILNELDIDILLKWFEDRVNVMSFADEMKKVIKTSNTIV